MSSTVEDPIVANLFRRPPKSAHTAWAAVADGQTARFFERRGGRWNELDTLSYAVTDPPSRDIGSDRPGRTHESSGTARHAIQPHVDLHEQAKRSFAERVATDLEEAASAGQFDVLFIVAPPRFLGYLRTALGPVARARIAGSIPKDLADAPLDKILEQLHRHAGTHSV